ncbi:MAG: hypothetical protein ABSG40_16925 [Terriglobales bacterium]
MKLIKQIENGPQVTEQFDYRDCGSRRAFLGGGFQEKLVGYSIENMLLMSTVAQNQRLAGTAGVSRPV